MSEKPVKSEIQISQKSYMKFTRILRRLEQSENLINNKIKVIACEGEIIEEHSHIFIEPPRFKEYSENFFDQISNEKTSISSIENLNVEEEISSRLIETDEYPDSSDLSGDE